MHYTSVSLTFASFDDIDRIVERLIFYQASSVLCQFSIARRRWRWCCKTAREIIDASWIDENSLRGNWLIFRFEEGAVIGKEVLKTFSRNCSFTKFRRNRCGRSDRTISINIFRSILLFHCLLRGLIRKTNIRKHLPPRNFYSCRFAHVYVSVCRKELPVTPISACKYICVFTPICINVRSTLTHRLILLYYLLFIILKLRRSLSIITKHISRYWRSSESLDTVLCHNCVLASE